MITPCYYKGERVNRPYDLKLMLLIYVLQMVCNVADMSALRRSPIWPTDLKTAANIHDVTTAPELMEATEEVFHGGSAYTAVEKREEIIHTNGHGQTIHCLCAYVVPKKAFLW